MSSGGVTSSSSSSSSSFRRSPLPRRQLPPRHRVQAPPAGLGAPPPAALPLGDASLGPGAAARPAGTAPAQEGAPRGERSVVAQKCRQSQISIIIVKLSYFLPHCLLFFRIKFFHRLQTGTGVWSPDGAAERSALWVSQVWQQLNACLSRLGTHEALLGPRLFLSCPLLPDNTHAVVRLVKHHRINTYYHYHIIALYIYGCIYCVYIQSQPK